ncbi:Su(z)12, partial [Symbiodinium sp. KB8]
MIDEFEDVSIEEKELMKLWNAHVAEYVHYSDANVPFLCEEFARKWGAHLIARGLRHNFLMHLLTLWDFAVIDYASVDHCIGVVDAFKGTVEAFEVGADEYAHAREENGEGGKEGDTTSSASNGSIAPFLNLIPLKALKKGRGMPVKQLMVAAAVSLV